MIPIGGNLSNAVNAFNRAAEQLNRSSAQLAQGHGAPRGIDGVETPAEFGTTTTHRDEPEAAEHARLQGAQEPDLARDVTDLLATQQALQAQIALARAENRTVGSLIDIFA